MKFSCQLLAGCMVFALAACDISVNSEDPNTAQDVAAAAPQQPAQVQMAEPEPGEGFNAESADRARQLALASGTEQQRAQARQQSSREMQDLRVEVDISDRKLRLFQGNRLRAEHDVAVGTEEWPTPTGSWEFHRVDINPEWNPPKSEEWAKDAEQAAPGSPDNPMGRARLVYRMPNTVHGTDDLNSLGKASSHGSLRVANEVVLDLAETLLKAGGAFEGQQWFQQMTQNRTNEYQVPLEQRIPITVKE